MLSIYQSHPCAGPLRKQHFDVSTPSGDSWTNFVPLKWSSSVEWNLRAVVESAFRKLERRIVLPAGPGRRCCRLKFADSTGIRTRNFAYNLIDDSGTCPTSEIPKRADVYPKWMPFIPILSHFP